MRLRLSPYADRRSVRAQVERTGRFLECHLPEWHEVEQAWTAQLPDAAEPQCDLGEDWDDIGGALEMRIGLDLAPKPQACKLLKWLPPERYVDLCEAVGFQRTCRSKGLPDGGAVDPILWSWERTSVEDPLGVGAEEPSLATWLDLMEISGLAHKHQD